MAHRLQYMKCICFTFIGKRFRRLYTVLITTQQGGILNGRSDPYHEDMSYESRLEILLDIQLKIGQTVARID